MSRVDESHKSQIDSVKEYYRSLYNRSMRTTFLFSLPAVVLTLITVYFYASVEDRAFYLQRLFETGEGFLIVVFAISAVICWAVFFWNQVSQSRKRAVLWKQSMESYEQLVLMESQFENEEDRRLASRQALLNASQDVSPVAK